MWNLPLSILGFTFARRRRTPPPIGNQPGHFESRLLPTIAILAAEPHAASDFLGEWVVQNEFGAGTLNIQRPGNEIEATITCLSPFGPIQLDFLEQKVPSGSHLKLNFRKGALDSETGNGTVKIRHNEDGTLSGLVKRKSKELDLKQRIAFTATRQEM